MRLGMQVSEARMVGQDEELAAHQEMSPALQRLDDCNELPLSGRVVLLRLVQALGVKLDRMPRPIPTLLQHTTNAKVGRVTDHARRTLSVKHLKTRSTR